MKKTIGMIMGLTIIAGIFTGCSSGKTLGTSEGKKYTIGIGQFGEHGSLDNCREGFIQGLAEEGFIE